MVILLTEPLYLELLPAARASVSVAQAMPCFEMCNVMRYDIKRILRRIHGTKCPFITAENFVHLNQMAKRLLAQATEVLINSSLV